MNKVSVERVEFAPLLDQSPEVIERIRNLRNSVEVSKYMYGDHQISTFEHAAWIESLRKKPCDRVMVVLYEKRVEGLVSLHAVSQEQKRAEWAFYLSEEIQGKGVGGVVEFKLLDLAFEQMGLEKLNCEVLETNPKVIEMHQKFGFKVEGLRRANVVKEGERLGVVLLGMLRTEWQEKRPHFSRLFRQDKKY